MEDCIKFGISDLNIHKLRDVIEFLSPYVKSKEDMLFGYLIGSIRTFMIGYTNKFYNRMPSLAEQNELWKMLFEHIEEIRSKITLEFGR
jgi:hypothetical protein